MSTSINPYSGASGATARTGVSGLVSGMDTDSLVESMTGNITSKIDSLKQQQQMLSWQQEAYQSVIDSLVSFNTKYLSSTSPNSLMNPNFFQNAIISSMGNNASAVTLGGTSSSIKDLVIQSVNKLAKTASVTTEDSHKISDQKIETGDIDLEGSRTVSALEGEGLNFTLGGAKYSVQLKDVELSTNTDPVKAAEENAQFAVDALNKAFKKEGMSESVKAGLVDGKMTIENIGKGGNSLTLTGASQQIAKATGLEVGEVVQEGSKMTGSNVINKEGSPITIGVTFAESVAKGNGTMTLDLDGRKATIDLKKIMAGATAGAGKLTMGELVTGINDQLDKQFGAGKVKVELAQGAAGDKKGTLSFTTGSGTSILSVASGDEGILGKTGAMNVNFGAANRMLMFEPLESSSNNLNTKLDFGTDANPKTYGFKINDVNFEVASDAITINGKEVRYDDGVSMNDIMMSINDSEAGVNMKYLSTTDRFTLTATQSGAAGKVEVTTMDAPTDGRVVLDMSSILFGDTTKFVGEKVGSDSSMTVSFDGGTSFATVERSSNNFEIDGVNFTLNSEFKSKDAGGAATSDNITFSAKTNTTEIVKAAKEMTDEYNKLIETLNSTVNTKKNRDYKPLTEAQKKAMSEDEIKAWNTKSKEGLLFGDSMLRSLASELRFAFSMPISGMSFGSIGITTSNDYADNGKLKFDETAFKAALDGNSEKVAKLFTSTNQSYNGEATNKGSMVTLSKTIEKFASTSGATKGALVEKAGYKASAVSVANSGMFKQAKTLQDQIDVWTDRLGSAKDRYYRQFTQMEMYLSKWNSQASMFQSQG